MKILIPDYYYKDIQKIDINNLLKNGIKYLIIDLDNTLVGWDCPLPTEDVRLWFDKLNELGFDVCLTSNNNRERVELFANDLGLQFIYKAKKPLKRGFREAMSKMNVVDRTRVACIGDQLFTDVLGGNRMGITTILVEPIAQKEFAWTMFVRKIEALFRNKLTRID